MIWFSEEAGEIEIAASPNFVMLISFLCLKNQ